MQVNKESYLLKFKKLYREKEGKDLTDQEALAHFERLAALVSVVYQPIKVNLIEGIPCPVCGKSEDFHFEDETNEKEFLISGLCQQCQDHTFKKYGK